MEISIKHKQICNRNWQVKYTFVLHVQNACDGRKLNWGEFIKPLKYMYIHVVAFVDYCKSWLVVMSDIVYIVPTLQIRLIFSTYPYNNRWCTHCKLHEAQLYIWCSTFKKKDISENRQQNFWNEILVSRARGSTAFVLWLFRRNKFWVGGCRGWKVWSCILKLDRGQTMPSTFWRIIGVVLGRHYVENIRKKI